MMMLWVKGTTFLGSTVQLLTYAKQATEAWRLILDHQDQHSHRSPTLNPWSPEFTLAWVTLLDEVLQQGCPVETGWATCNCWHLLTMVSLVTAQLSSIPPFFSDTEPITDSTAQQTCHAAIQAGSANDWYIFGLEKTAAPPKLHCSRAFASLCTLL